jgi:cytochrome c oxidase cbb3-type subunit 2
MKTHRLVGVPYTDEQIASARADFLAQADPLGDVDALAARYPGAHAANPDGLPGVSEMDALVAYLQVLGTMVDFSTFTPDASR